jgi:hypothetical protein
LPAVVTTLSSAGLIGRIVPNGASFVSKGASRREGRLRTVIWGAFVLLLGWSSAAWSQAVQQQSAPAHAAPAPQAAPMPAAPPVNPPVHGNPGLVEELGKLLRNSASSLSSTLKDSRDAIEGLNSRARDATEDLPRLGPQTVVHGRTACPLAPNGAPDCKTASDHLCKSKGYKEGKSVDIESAEKCSAKVYLSGRTGAPGECRTENFVTSAVCQ